MTMRGPGRPFQKGKSNNPGGRNKAYYKVQRLISEQTDDGQEVVDFVLAVMRGTSDAELLDPKCRIWAAGWLADRLIGKAAQVVVPVEEAPPAQMDDSALSDAELELLAKLDDSRPARVLQLVPPEPDQV